MLIPEIEERLKNIEYHAGNGDHAAAHVAADCLLRDYVAGLAKRTDAVGRCAQVVARVYGIKFYRWFS